MIGNSRVIWLYLRKIQRWDWRAIGLCFLVSSLVWLFTALNKTYTTFISYPIRFTYDQTNIVPLREPPQRIMLEVSGNGWTLMRHSIGIGMNPFAIKITNPLSYKNLASSKLLSAIAENLLDLKILQIQPDSLLFAYSRIIEKSVVLRLDQSKLRLQKGYRLASDIQIKPKLVSLRGADSLVRASPDTLYVEPDDEEISEDYNEKLQINYPKHTYLSCSVEKVMVSFKVEPFNELNRLTPITFVNFPKDSSVWVIEKNIEVSYWLDNQVDTSQYKTDSLQLVAAFDKINWKDSTITPQILGVSEETEVYFKPAKLKVYAKKNRNNRRYRNR